jgi:hypothetical protein
MINRLVSHSLVAIASVALAACTSLRVKSDVNTALYRAGKCHSFAWTGTFRDDSPLRDTIANPVNESRLRAAIADHLQTLGMVAASADADCLIGYGIGSRTVMTYGDWGAEPGWGWGWGWGPGFPGRYYGGFDADVPYTYRQGVIGVDLYDAKSKEALWHASVDQNLENSVGPDAERKIKAAVDAIFGKFPT